MAKQVTKTPEIIAQLQSVAGASVDAASLPVFEAILANTLPIRKRGSMYNGARISQGMMQLMTDYATKNGVPLQILHNDGVLPIGKVFQGKVVMDASGQPEARVLFYVDPTDPKLVAQVDNGTVDEVSLGALPEHALCSECGYDFLGADVPNDVYFSRTDPEGHTLGENGVHLTLTGLARFYETSLVGNGAVQGAKIVDRTKAVMASLKSDPLALAAAEKSSAHILFASATPSPKETTNMDFTAVATQVATLAASEATLKASVAALTTSETTLKAQVVELTTKLAASATQVATLTTQLTPETAAKFTALAAANEATLKFVREQAQKILVATGSKDKADTLTLEQAIEAINAGQVKLASLIPLGGVALSDAKTDTANDVKAGPALDAFRTR